MSNNKMLIDATHPEETRVVVLRSGRVEEFDYESAARKLLRGNIYLAKVTRVEPSLQAAFVEYGGNRHGFLAFNEIHPDYYQIPMADRQALLDEEAAAEAREEAEVDAHAERLARRQRGRDRNRRPRHGAAPGTGDQPSVDTVGAGSDEPASADADEADVSTHDDDAGDAPRTLAERAHSGDDVLSEDAPYAESQSTDTGDDDDEDDAGDDAGDDSHDHDAHDHDTHDHGDSDDEDDADEPVDAAHADGSDDAGDGEDEAGDDGDSNIEVVAPAAKGTEPEVETVIFLREILHASGACKFSMLAKTASGLSSGSPMPIKTILLMRGG